MKNRFGFAWKGFSLFMLLCLAALAPAATPAKFRNGIIIMGFQPGVTPASQQAIIATAGAVELRVSKAGAHILRVPPGAELRLVQMLQAIPEVRYAEPDYEMHPDGAPNDPSFNAQWAHHNTGQTVNGTTGTAGADERTLAAWNITVGSPSVVVAVTDTGVDYTHPDLAPNMWSNPGGVNSCPAGTHGYNVLTSTCDPMDDDTTYGGHGTHVSGIIGAAGDNAVGVAGVNWVTQIMGVKWINATGTGYTSDLITALDWVVNAKTAGVNVRVVNDSATWAGTAFSQSLSDTIDLLGSNDILFVTAAGNTAQNNDTTPRYPCVYDRPTQLCVAATNQNDQLWSQSDWGATTVNLAAPGVNIYSTLRDSTYGYISGGSMACAQVSGAAALALSMGYQTVANLRASLLNSVDVLSSLNGLVATSGRLNICKAIPGCPVSATSAPANTSPPTIAGNAQQGQTFTATTGKWSGGPPSFAFQWNRCNGGSCAAITGATAPTYTSLAAADIGATLAVTVTASNTSGSTSVTSSPTAAIAAAAAPPWSVISNVQDGQTLSGKIQWQVSVTTAASNIIGVEFFIDGTQTWASEQSPYYYGANDYLDTSTIAPGAHVLAVRALGVDSSVAYATASVTIVAGSGAPGIAFVQANSAQGVSVGSLSVPFSANNTAGNLIIAFVRGSTKTQSVAVSDSAGNIYAQAVSQVQNQDGHQIFIFYAKNIAGGSNTVTVKFSGSNSHPWLAIYEYSGLSTTNPLDQTAAAQGYSSSVSTGPTSATTAANELVFAGTGLPSTGVATATAGPGYYILEQNPSGSSAANEGQMAQATGPFAGTFTLNASTNWSAVIATFSATGRAPAPDFTLSASPSSQTVTQGNGTSYNISVSALNGFNGTVSLSASGFGSGAGGSFNPASISGSGSSTLSISTTSAAQAGTFTLIITATSGSLTHTASVTLTVNPASTGGGGGVALVQASAVEGSGVTAVSQAFSAANTAGNMIIAFVRMSSASQSVSVTDSAGNSYNNAVSQAQSTDGHQVYIFYASNIHGGANAVTATFSATNNHPWMAIYEYSGVTSLSSTAANQGSGTSVSTGNTASTSASSTLVFSGLGLPASSGAAVTAGAGFTLEQQDPNQSGSRAASEDEITSTTGPFAGTYMLSASANWSAVVATFTGGGSPPAPDFTVSATPSSQNVVQGGNTTYTISISPLNGFSGSVSLSASGFGTGASGSFSPGSISGSGSSTLTVSTTGSAQTGSFPLTITAASGSLSHTASVTLVVNTTGTGSTITRVQAAAVEGSGVTSVSQSFAGANTAGNMIIAFVRMSSTSQTVSLTDSAGNTYADAVSQGQSADGHQVHIFYAANIKAGSNTVTATFSAANNHPWMAIYEYSGVTALDTTARAQGSSNTPNSGPTAITSASSELVFGGMGLPSSSGVAVSAGSGWTMEQQDPNQSGSRAASEDLLATSSAAFAATFSLNGWANWSCIVATFR